MPTKIFTTLGGDCPFGRGCELDSLRCRQCPHYFRAGTGTFFWCSNPAQKEGAGKMQPEKRKRGRPRKNAK